ncbi:MAG: hypothetical protein QNK32_00755 [Porticoccus sp.]|nr:hypothetical protein [Porticoccus sp.]
MIQTMDDIQWWELQQAMFSLSNLSPQWRTKCRLNGSISNWDHEWFYHFSDRDYKDIEWVELKIESDEQKELVLSDLRKIHLPGELTENGVKVFGYVPKDSFVEYL